MRMKQVKAIKTLFFIFLVLGLGAVLAAGTPAGTEIRNQASATYTDSSGQPQSTTSNEVVTVVQPVYGFTITPDGTETDPGQTQSAVPGGTVYFPYTVTNTGNTTDTIDLETSTDSTQDDFTLENPEIYLDENCDGQIDPGESVVSSVELAADESACLVVAATVPTSATEGQSGLVDLSGTSQGDDTITDEDNWAEALATENAVLTSTKSATPTGEVAPGDTIAYTIEGSNVGGSDACAIENVANLDGQDLDGIMIYDDIPAGTTYVVGSASGTAGAGDVTIIYFLDTNDDGTVDLVTDQESDISDPAQVVSIGMLIEDPNSPNYDHTTDDPFFPQGAQYELTFSVTADDGLTPDDTIENSATVNFDGNCDGDGDDDGEEVTSNTTTNGVAPTYEVYNGPQDDPDSDGNGFTNTYTDPTGKTWNYDETTDTTDPRDDDAETITDEVYGGDTVYFPFTLQNNGNTDDTFDLSLNIVDPDTNDDADPTTWSCQIVASDGTTPISGPVGPVPAGGTFDYVVKCSIPADYVEDGSEDAAHIEVTATSEGDPTQSNKVTGIVEDVLPGYAVDAAQPGNSNDGDENNDDPPAQSTDPGTSVEVPFEVTNTGHNPDTYDITSELPDGWTGTVYPDEDCDGAMDDPAPAPVTDTGLLDAGETACFILVVDVPEDQAPITLDPNDPNDDNVTITVTSHADPDNSNDTISTDIEVNPVAAIDFSPDRSGTVTSPGTIVYSHTITNDGNEPADVTFALDTDKDNWTYQIRVDTNGDGSLDDESWVTLDPDNPTSTLLDDLPAGESRDVEVRVIVPDGEPVGTVDAADITANATFDSGATAEDTVTDTTTVVGGDLRLEKEVDKTEAQPGDQLTYTVTASNIGTADLTQVIITDPLPGYTDFVSVSATISGFDSGATVLYSNDGSSWTDDPSTISLASGQSIYVAVDTDGDGDITDADVMPPGAEIVITFVVEVQ